MDGEVHIEGHILLYDPSVCSVVAICFNASNMGKHDRYPYIPRIVAFGQCVVMKTIDNGGMEYSRELGGECIEVCWIQMVESLVYMLTKSKLFIVHK